MEGEAKCKFAPFCILFNSAFKIQRFCILHSTFCIPHSVLLFDFNIEHRRIVVFAERLVRIVLSGFVVVLEEDERHFLEGDGLAVFAVTFDVGFGETFHTHHLEHHGEVEVDVEQFLFPFDADDRCGVELKVFYFDFFHWIFFGYWLLATGYWQLYDK